jgi:hypothetical protein
MIYLEGFLSFGKKGNEKVKKTWEQQIQDVSDSFNKIKNGKGDKYYFINAQLSDNSYYISDINIMLSFSKKDSEYKVTDLRETDLRPGMIGRSDKGVYMIDKDIYDKYLKLAEDISNFLDEKSEKEFGKSNTVVDDNGISELDVVDLTLDEINYELSKVYEEYIGKSFNSKYLTHYGIVISPINILLKDMNYL